MKMTGTEINQSLSERLKENIGRHLYGIFGSYYQLDKYERESLPHISLPEGLTPEIISLNDAILNRIEDEDLRKIIKSEVNIPRFTQDKLNKVLNSLLENQLKINRILFLKQFELVFAYNLDLQSIRARAANQNHIIMMLPGKLIRNRAELFVESRSQFHRTLPAQVLTEDHLWEIQDAN